MKIIFPILGVALITIIALQLYFLRRKMPEVILQYPDERLRMVSKKVKHIDHEVVQVVKKLKKLLKKLDKPFSLGIGIAAPQIGVHQRIIVLKLSKNIYQEMINPEVISKRLNFLSPSTCMSTKGVHIIPRHLWYEVRYQDVGGKFHHQILRGAKAILFEQEIDHLNGILITDY